jgi:hypothetical protein
MTVTRSIIPVAALLPIQIQNALLNNDAQRISKSGQKARGSYALSP